MAHTGAVRPPPGRRLRHNSLASCPTAAETVAVPAGFALNIGQSSGAAGALDAGAAHGGDSACTLGSFSA
ncbi:MAG: hypothetical protein ACYTGS_22395, partial [Planctomycetota bacterium]